MSIFGEQDRILDRHRFLFGTATSSFQIEGGYDEGGRSPSIWDDFCLEKGGVKNGDDGRRGINHYRLWEQDLDLIKEFNFDAYRFSISWSRVLQEKDRVNPEGIKFYRSIIDRLNKLGIKPFLTLYHWDLPSYLEATGGWVNRETSFEFAKFAKLIAQEFGGDVCSIATLNEPLCSAFCGYLWGVHAPGYKDRRMAFQASHHLMLAHGLAMKELRAFAPDCKNGIVLNFTPAYPASDSHEDQYAADLANAEHNFWFADAIFQKKYPEVLIAAQPDSKPVIFPGDMEIIAEPIDFLGVNFYTSQLVKFKDSYYQPVQTDAKKTDIGWDVNSSAFYDLFTKLLSKYDDLPPIYITENGAAYNDEPDSDSTVNDQNRIDYYKQHLAEVEKLVVEGHDIRGYFAWSLLDNFEWAEGYSQRFGLVYVDYETMERLPKNSALMFRDILAGRI